MTVLRDTAEQEMTTLRQTNLRRLQELNAEIQRFEIEMREMEEVRVNNPPKQEGEGGGGSTYFMP